MLSRNMTENLHLLIEQHLKMWGKQNLTAMDGTLGNGHDLEFLHRQNQVQHLYGFDVQQQALDASGAKIVGTNKEVRLILDSHHNLEHYIEGEIDLALFNLGYLPGADKSIVTHTETTLVALEKVMDKLSDGGLLAVMTYPGHEEGRKEHEHIEAFLTTYHVREYSILHLNVKNVKKACPNCFLIIRKS
ncbi:MAG: class I SAM-dependent methyltransferase [Niameybacter sp.]|uniref:tRNA (mnm(5)s(2)U34)-methyltransferase n=1 Tax=Niameybacter sp. TaxID=2033640 RepID=UPI002FC69A02